MLTTTKRLTKIEQLATLIELETLERYKKEGITYFGHEKHCQTSVKIGNKYTKIDINTSGKLMIDNEGNIFGIKSYGVINKAHYFGTLDTINQYYWGDYKPIKKEVI